MFSGGTAGQIPSNPQVRSQGADPELVVNWLTAARTGVGMEWQGTSNDLTTQHITRVQRPSMAVPVFNFMFGDDTLPFPVATIVNKVCTCNRHCQNLPKFCFFFVLLKKVVFD